MKAWLALSVALLGTGCLSHVRSLQPLCTDDNAVGLPAIVGTWAEEDDDDSTLRFALPDQENDDARHLLLTVKDKEEGGPGVFAVAFTTIGDDTYWNLTPLAGDEEEDLWRAHRLSTHGFARIALDGNRLEIAFLDADWLKTALADGRVALAHTRVDGEIVLTASTDELRAFVAACAADPKAFAKVGAFVRQAP